MVNRKISSTKVKCCFCGNKILRYGNNSQPIKEGLCCDLCNIKLVIPTRIKTIGANNV